MKRIPLLLLAISVLHATKAQDAGLDKFLFKTQEINFPKKILPADKRTYTYSNYSIDSINFNENDAIQFNGFTKAPNGVVEVAAKFGREGLAFAEQQTRPRLDNTTKATLYSIVVVAKASGIIVVECKDADYKKSNFSEFRKTFSTKEFGSEREAKDELGIVSKSWLADARVSFQQTVVQELKYYTNMVFGYPAYTVTLHLWQLSAKGNPQYASYEANCNSIKNAFAEVKLTGIPAGMLSKLAPALAYFDSIPKLFAEDNKQHKKMRYSAYYNQMVTYFNIDDLAKAEAFAYLLITNDYDSKDGKKMLEAIKERKEEWEANKVASSHYLIAGENGCVFYRRE